MFPSHTIKKPPQVVFWGGFFIVCNGPVFEPCLGSTRSPGANENERSEPGRRGAWMRRVILVPQPHNRKRPPCEAFFYYELWVQYENLRSTQTIRVWRREAVPAHPCAPRHRFVLNNAKLNARDSAARRARCMDAPGNPCFPATLDSCQKHAGMT